MSNILLALAATINSLTLVIEGFTLCFARTADLDLSLKATKDLWSMLLIIVCDNTQLLQHLV